MLLFVNSPPLGLTNSRTALLPRAVSTRKPLNPHSRRTPTICAQQWTNSSESSTEGLPIIERLRLLTDPTLNGSARQVLAIDLLGEVPGIISSLNKAGASSSKRDNGLNDVTRQLRDDIIPDLVNNGPQYVARALENISSPPGSSSTGSAAPQATMPPVQFSPAEVTQEIQNVFKKTPDGLYTPDYEVLLSEDGFEVRRYPSLILAQTNMSSDTDKDGTITEYEYARAMGSGFGNLASYLFGKNQSQSAMKMTTPVLMDVNKGASAPGSETEQVEDGIGQESESETMSFIIGEYQNVADVPVPEDGSVQVVEVPGGVFAAAEFSGYVTKGEARRQSDRIVDLVQKSEKVGLVSEDQPDFKFLVYNPPYTLPNLRRNEVLVAVSLAAGEEGTNSTEDA